MTILCIITARGGSKRIPKKNIKEFMGKPMISYAINAAKDAGIFDEIMVSTDDEEIAAISKKYGAEVPFMRSEKTANDFATTRDVLNEVLDEYEKRNKHFDYFCCIYPCVPLLNGEILKNACSNFINSGANSLVPVVKYSFPIQRAFKVNSDNYIEYREPNHALTRSQDLEPMYHDVGMYYFAKTKSFKKYNTIIGEKTAFYEMSEEQIQDIDTLDDWKLAELKYEIIHKRG